MSEPLAPTIDAPEPQAEDEKPELFEYVVKAPVEGEHGGYVVHLKKPSEAQLLVLLRMTDMVEDSPLNAVRLYLDAVEALMPREESHRLQRGLLKGHLDSEDFVEIGPATIRHFFPELNDGKPQQKQHGPVATRRAKKSRR